MSLALAALLGVAALTGQASVIDGDTLEIHGTRIRLHGIDAPESDQVCTRADGRRWRCGQQAALALKATIAGRPVECVARDTDRYGRTVAECQVAGASLNAWMVRHGWAVAYRQFSTAYVGAEEAARRERLNLWSGQFVPPASHRQQGRSRPAPETPAGGCLIKGNIGPSGRIYHVPGQQHYARTRIDPKAGERWFCTEAEAKAAGWRRARE